MPQCVLHTKAIFFGIEGATETPRLGLLAVNGNFCVHLRNEMEFFISGAEQTCTEQARNKALRG